MKKKDVLKVLNGDEAAKAIKKHPSQVSRLPDIIPEKYQAKLRTACKRKSDKIIKIVEGL